MVLPGPRPLSTGDAQLIVTMFKDTTGTPDRIVVVTVLSTNSIGIYEYVRLADNAYHFVSDICARHASFTLNFTAANQLQITAFAIDSPAGTNDRVLFITMNDASQSPDTFEAVSIVLTPGAVNTLVDVTCVIAGTNQPTDSNAMVVVSTAASTTRVLTFFQDDFHRADLTESSGTYTLTYDDAKVLAVDTTILPAQDYSMIVVGSQVLLMRAESDLVNSNLYEMSTAGVLTEAFEPWATGGMGTTMTAVAAGIPALTAIDGSFAVAAPFGNSAGAGGEAAMLITAFDVDLI